jgi:hypothetical protein
MCLALATAGCGEGDSSSSSSAVTSSATKVTAVSPVSTAGSEPTASTGEPQVPGDDGGGATTAASQATTVERTTTASTQEATTSSASVPASTTTVTWPNGLPGRTPPSDATDDIVSLIPPGFSARYSWELAGQILTGLEQKWEGCATVTMDSLFGALSEQAAVVYDIRNQEACGDDSVAGEDLVVVMEPTSVVNLEPVDWQVVRASRQYVCLRGVSGGLCT